MALEVYFSSLKLNMRACEEEWIIFRQLKGVTFRVSLMVLCSIAPRSEKPYVSSMVCSHSIEILNSFNSRSPHFGFTM